MGQVLVDELLVEGKIQGRNYAYRPVIIEIPESKKFDPTRLLGKYLPIKVTEISKYSLVGELIS
jgi:tRNA A37 methylthiotransferase MiaB